MQYGFSVTLQNSLQTRSCIGVETEVQNIFMEHVLNQGGYDKITSGAFFAESAIISPIDFVWKLNLHFYQFICSLADLGAELDRPSKTVPKKL